MPDLLGQAGWWVHQVTVERFTGSSGYGDAYTTATGVPCFVHDGAKLVIGPDGATVTASSTVAFPPSVARIPVDSWITLPAMFGGRRALVIASAVGDAGNQPTPNHQEISLR